MNQEWEALLSLVPRLQDTSIDWRQAEKSVLGSLIEQMKDTSQDEIWHQEGNVWNHTKLVCEQLIRLPEYKALAQDMRETLFLSALMHDIGKVRTTRMEDGRVRTPRHGEVGSRMARVLLWTQCGLCGTKEAQIRRETICRMVRYHMAPPHMLYGDQYRHRVLRIAAEGEPMPGFTLSHLSVLSEADNRGRICDDLNEQIALIKRSCEYAREQGCFEGPMPFYDAHVQRAFFAGRSVQPDMPLDDDTWGEVTLLCGLPGTGKDAWIRENMPHLPVVSLDDMRDMMEVNPTDKQNAVGQACREQAKEFLRRRQPFVFHAANLTPLTREPLVSLFEQYGARVRLVYMETSWQELLKRNALRVKCVPEHMIAAMLEKMTVPERHEARQVEWICV